ncbi:X-ray repair cross-complementing protein 5 [Phytophthora ramorum]|uniref:X-ray repair cross-complementing protein 5 n=1 Tax=Phytophthora ramorum TaxID=164328 RepID=UPI003094B65F|nr:X-ray repair cross-complementing protein 5 [Phytophthora ramorum]
MSRSKEAVVVLLDVGASMRVPLRERVATDRSRQDATDDLQHTRFAAALAAVESVVQQKLFFKPKDEVGIIAYGSEDTDNQLNEEQGSDEYRNVQVVNSIDAPTLHMVKRLRELKPSKPEQTKVDILDGMIVALDLLFRRTDGKKYDKRLMVITDAAAKIADAGDLESIVAMIQNMEVKLQVIGLDFQNTTSKPQQNQGGDEEMPEAVVKAEVPTTEPSDMERIKAENEKMLVSIANEVGGEVCSVAKRMQLLAQGMKKTVALTTKFRGPLEFGDVLKIPVYCYLKTKTATLPTLSKESQSSYEKETAGKVKLDRRYTSPQNIDEEVPPDQQVKAYRYGAEKVPFASADVEFLKFLTEKSLKALGFLDKTQINHAKFVAGTDIFIAEPGKPHAAQCFAALIDAMVELDQVIIARFVSRKNAAPKIVALIPHAPSSHGENYYAMWSQQLPYEEDVRNYEFAPLKTSKYAPSEEQQSLADKLVDSLSIRDDKADEVGACFNPVIRRFFHAVSSRALDESVRVPPLPADMESSLKMDPSRQEKISTLIESFGDAFQLKEAVKKAKDRKKKAFWSDVPSVSVKEEDLKEEHDDAAGGDAGSDLELDLDELLDGGDVTSVGSMNPIADFEALVESSQAKASRRQQLTVAVTGMETQTEKFLSQSGSEFFPKALQCLAHFRKRSSEIQYSAQFNEFLTKLKTTLTEDSEAWKAVKGADISLLSSAEDPSLDVSPAEARAFLYGEEEVDVNLAAASLSSQVEAMEEDDDMFADFE